MTDAVADGVMDLGTAKRSSRSIFDRLRGVPIYVWLLLIVLVPNALLIGTSFLKTSQGFLVLEPSLVNYTRLYNSSGFWALLARTLRLSFLACMVGALVAYPLAYYVARVVRRNKAIFVVPHHHPALDQPVDAGLRLAADPRPIRPAQLVPGDERYSRQAVRSLSHTPASVILVFAYISIPFIFISCLTAFEKIPQALFEASQDAGASAFQTFLHVVWPLTRRGLAIGFSLAFLVTVGDYVTPSMVGGIDGTTIGVVISSQFGMANNWPYGSALAVVLILGVGAIVGVVLWLCPTRGILQGDEGVKAAPAHAGAAARIGRVGGMVGSLAAVGFLYAPLVLMMIFSFGASELQAFPIAEFSLRWYRDLLGNSGLLAAARRSLVVGFCVVTFSTLIGTSFALLLHYGRIKGARFCEFALALPLATPGVVLGIVMVLGTELASVPSGLARTIIGQSSFVMPVTMMLVLARLRQLDPSLMEASLDLGADRWRSFIHVLLPLIRSAIIGGALLGLTLSADDVMVTLFLTGSEQTLPIWVFNQMRFRLHPVVNALFTLLAILCLAIVLVSTRMGRKDGGAA